MAFEIRAEKFYRALQWLNRSRRERTICIAGSAEPGLKFQLFNISGLSLALFHSS